MTPEDEQIVLCRLEEIAQILRVLVAHFVPVKSQRPKHTAVLGTATYNREERERIALRKALKGEKAPTPPTGA